MPHNNAFVFFGTDIFSVQTLETLKERGFLPALIVTATSKPQGRKQVVTPPPVKIWADKESVPTLQADSFEEQTITELRDRGPFAFFITASFGAIIPQTVLDIPTCGSFNIHPSPLPLLRGPSPLQTAILNDMRTTGVSLMCMDDKMDHGPIVAFEGLIEDLLPHGWPPTTEELGLLLFTRGAHILADHIPALCAGDVTTTPQDHTKATYTKFITKQDAEITLHDDAYTNFLKYQAYRTWPRAFFYDSNGKRNVITEATYTDGVFTINKVIPEGKAEQSYEG